MARVDLPLDWWANGGYPAMMGELRCTKATAHRTVHPMTSESTGARVGIPLRTSESRHPWLPPDVAPRHHRDAPTGPDRVVAGVILA